MELVTLFLNWILFSHLRPRLILPQCHQYALRMWWFYGGEPLHIAVLWFVTPCSLVGGNNVLGVRTYCLYLQGWNTNVTILLLSPEDLNMTYVFRFKSIPTHLSASHFMLCNLSRCVNKLGIMLPLMPLLLSTNCFVEQVHSYRQDKGKTRNRRILSRDPLGGGGCANSTGALLCSPTICNPSCRTICLDFWKEIYGSLSYWLHYLYTSSLTWFLCFHSLCF
jgi:hypothetical protein